MRTITLGVALATAALLVTAAAAEQKVKVNPCKYDVEKLCKDIPPRSTERLACLDQHRSELSAACQAHLSKREAHHKSHHKRGNPNRAWFSACNEDLKSFCRDIPAGPGVLAKCLDEHQAELSPGCKIALDGRKAAR